MLMPHLLILCSFRLSSPFILSHPLLLPTTEAMKIFSSKRFKFYLVTICMQIFLSVSTANPIFSNCPGVGYSQSSTFAANLDRLLSTLRLKAPLQVFYNHTIGEQPEQVYGLFNCRGDITLQECQNCINTATTEIKQTCTNSTQGVAWYDFCLLRYSDRYFFGLIQSSGFYYYNDKFIEKPHGEVDTAVELVSNMLKQVSSGPSMFATDSRPSESIYSLAQCTTDLSKDQCNKCLEDVMRKIRSCCMWKRGWRYSAPSCSIRYETYLFFGGSKPHEELQWRQCPEYGSTASPVFMTNVNRLLLILNSNAPQPGFFNSSNGDDGDRVYGLALCRGNLDQAACQECLGTAMYDLVQTCPNKTQAILWYDNCLLRYSNESFFGIPDTQGLCIKSNTVDNTGSQSIELIYRLVKTASEEKLMFAREQLQVSETERRNYYAQCTRDLESRKCHECLKKVIAEVNTTCIQMKGWHYFGASCSIMYQVTEVVNPAPQPAPLHPATQPIPSQGMSLTH